MGGVRILVALSVALSWLWLTTRAQAASPNELSVVAREKAAAVSFLYAKAHNQIATLAQGRVFSAYLDATTQGEGVRIQRRMQAALAAMNGRFGLQDFVLIDRGGAVIAASRGKDKTKIFDPARDRLIKDGFELAPRKAAASTVKRGQGRAIVFVAPVSWRGEQEFVLRAEQALDAYRSILARDNGPKRFVVLVADDGAVLFDSRGETKGAFKVAGLSLGALKRTLNVADDAGAGEVDGGKQRFAVAYQGTGPWAVVVAEEIVPPHRCPQNGARLCG